MSWGESQDQCMNSQPWKSLKEMNVFKYKMSQFNYNNKMLGTSCK